MKLHPKVCNRARRQHREASKQQPITAFNSQNAHLKAVLAAAGFGVGSGALTTRDGEMWRSPLVISVAGAR